MKTNRLVTGSRDLLKNAVRQTGRATAFIRPLPDFLVIGTKRGGTTSFYFDLIEHPAIVRLFPPPLPGIKPDATKGVHYFDSNYTRGENWYRSYMPSLGARAVHAARLHDPVLTGEASPYYLFHPDAARRAHALIPDAKIIVLVREPTMRTYSHWKERRRGGAEPLEFEAALDAEPKRLAGERERLMADPSYASYAWEQQSYATQSIYSPSLRAWSDLYGHEQVKVLSSEHYYANPAAALRGVDTFLGLTPRTQSSGKVRNAAPGEPLPETVRSRLGSEFAESNAYLLATYGREVLPWL